MTCEYCGDTGIKLSGEECECMRVPDIKVQNSLSIEWFPKNYLDIDFNKIMCPNKKLADTLLDLRSAILDLKYITKNFWIQSESKTGKTVFSYDLIKSLFEQGVPVFPLVDLMELDNIIDCIHKNISSIYIPDEVNIIDIYKVPVLILKYSIDKKYEAYNALHTLIDRRTRRGLGTIIISSVDIDNCFPSNVEIKKGNGDFGTIQVINELRSK